MSIATRIQSIYENVGDVYDTITNVTLPEHKNIENIPRTIRDSYLEIINNGINVIYDNWEKVTGEGTSLTLTPTEEAPMQIVYKGNTYQNGEPTPDTPIPIQVVSGDNSIEVCGKNLLNRATCEENKAFGWADGNTISETGSLASDYIRVNIGDNVVCSYGCQKIFYDKNKQYIGVLKSNGNVEPNGEYANIATTFTIPNVSNICYVRLGFRASYASGTNLLTANIMVNKGTTLLPYEPYTGASYPINLPVENLFSSEMEFGSLNNTNGTTEENSNCIRSKDFISTEPNTTYTISCNFSYHIYVYEYGADYSFIRYTGAGTNEYLSPRTLTLSNTTKYIKVRTIASLVENNTPSLWQLEKGTKANHYTPYGTTPIWLGWIRNTNYGDKIDKSTGKNLIQTDTIDYSASTYNITLGKTLEIGTYTFSGITNATSGQFVLYGIDENSTQETLLANKNWNTFSTGYSFTTTKKYVSLRIYTNTASKGYIMLNSGSTALPYEPYGTGWYLKKEIGKVVLNGTEEWYLQTESVGQFKTFIAPLVTQNNGYSNYFIVKTTYTESGKPYLRLNNGLIWGEMGTNFLSEVSVSALETWLSTHNTEVYYVLATPTYTLIEGELLNQLEAIKMSYEGQTNLSQTNNDLPFILNPSALEKV